METKISSIYKGLKLVSEWGIDKVIVESDSRIAIDWILDDNLDCMFMPSILLACRHMIQMSQRSNKTITLMWTRREANHRAHELANLHLMDVLCWRP